MTDNLPAPREDAEVEEVEVKRPRTKSFHSSPWLSPVSKHSPLPPKNRLYHRKDWSIEGTPSIAGRTPRTDKRCSLCMIVRNLVEREENSLDPEQAFWAEYDITQMMFFGYTNKEIIDYLWAGYGYKVRSDSITNHKNKHIPNPELVKLQRYQHIAERGIDPEFFRKTMKLPYQVIDTVIEGIDSRAIMPTIGDAQKALEFLYKLFEERDRYDRERMHLEALETAIEKAVDDPNTMRKVMRNIYTEIRRQEQQDEITA